MKPSRENPWINLGVNILLPSIILTKFSSEQYLGPVWGLVIALSFPLLYGLYDVVAAKRYNFISLLGIISILLTGGIGLLKLPAEWLPIKEAAIPLLIGCGVLISVWTKWSLVTQLLSQLVDLETITTKFTMEQQLTFKKRTTLATYIIASSFFVSAILNYVLAKVIVTSPTGSAEFSAQVGTMTALSYPVIVLPSMVIMIVALMLVIRTLEKLTGKPLQDLLISKK